MRRRVRVSPEKKDDFFSSEKVFDVVYHEGTKEISLSPKEQSCFVFAKCHGGMGNTSSFSFLGRVGARSTSEFTYPHAHKHTTPTRRVNHNSIPSRACACVLVEKDDDGEEKRRTKVSIMPLIFSDSFFLTPESTDERATAVLRAEDNEQTNIKDQPTHPPKKTKPDLQYYCSTTTITALE